jgi:hypothetical protein
MGKTLDLLYFIGVFVAKSINLCNEIAAPARVFVRFWISIPREPPLPYQAISSTAPISRQNPPSVGKDSLGAIALTQRLAAGASGSELFLFVAFFESAATPCPGWAN